MFDCLSYTTPSFPILSSECASLNSGTTLPDWSSLTDFLPDRSGNKYKDTSYQEVSAYLTPDQSYQTNLI